MKTSLYFKQLSISTTFFLALCLVTIAEAQVIEDVIVTSEKRSESLQDILGSNFNASTIQSSHEKSRYNYLTVPKGGCLLGHFSP